MSAKKMILIAVVIVLLPFGLSLAGTVFGGGEEPFLVMPDEKHKACVRDTETMRLRHMYILKEIRDEVIRDGIRGDLKLETCAECHTSRAEFCDRCHHHVNLEPDCFGCHYYP
jgi:hypothetical protein